MYHTGTLEELDNIMTNENEGLLFKASFSLIA